MWFLLLGLSASAAEIDVTVVPDPPLTRKARWPVPPRPEITASRGEVLLDGQLNDAVWREAVKAPPLGPWMLGPTPPETQLMVVRSPQGLALGWEGLTADDRVEMLIDPDGLGSRWWRLRLTDPPVLHSCGLDELPPTARPSPVHTQAAPCRVHEEAIAIRGDGQAEVVVPWKLLGDSTSAMRIQWRQWRGKGGGTWAPNGRADARPEHGLTVELPHIAAKVKLEQRVGDGLEQYIAVDRIGKVPGGTWVWRRLREGVQVAKGRLTLEAGQREVQIPMIEPVVGLEVLEIGPPMDRPLRPVVVARVRGAAPHVWGTSVVVEHEVSLRWSTSIPLEDVEVCLIGSELRGCAQVTLPVGSGKIFVEWPRSWGDQAQVEIAALGVEVAVLRE